MTPLGLVFCNDKLNFFPVQNIYPYPSKGSNYFKIIPGKYEFSIMWIIEPVLYSNDENSLHYLCLKQLHIKYFSYVLFTRTFGSLFTFFTRRLLDNVGKESEREKVRERQRAKQFSVQLTFSSTSYPYSNIRCIILTDDDSN